VRAALGANGGSILSIQGGEDGLCFLLSAEGVADVESCWCCAGDMSVTWESEAVTPAEVQQ
jgi:hypothetical protein